MFSVRAETGEVRREAGTHRVLEEFGGVTGGQCLWQLISELAAGRTVVLSV